MAKSGKKSSAGAGKGHDTPAMRQFKQFKQQHPDCVLFFRMGDFYELFYDDAKLAHRVMGVTLTQRTEGIPMAGVPYHSVESYLRKMIQAGHRVAVCEQMEDPSQAKGVVRRDVTRVITPGTLTDESLLDEGSENPLAALMFHGDEQVSVAWAELSTGAFSIATFDADQAGDELARIAPREALFVETADGDTPPRVQQIAQGVGCVLTGRPGWHFRLDDAAEVLRKQYEVATLGGFGLEDDDPAIGPAAAIITYLLETQRMDVAADDPKAVASARRSAATHRIAHLQPPRRFERAQHLVIDHVSLRSLEIDRTIRTGETAGSVLGVLQDCVTAMGKRLLRHWLCYPLCDSGAIADRQRVVGAMVDDARFLDGLRDALDPVQDIQRITSRIAVGRATPRDLVALGRSTAPIRGIVNLLGDRPSVQPWHERIAQVADELAGLAAHIHAACKDDPKPHLRDGGLIRDGFDKQLDEDRGASHGADERLRAYQKSLIEQTGIASLKVGYNKVFGYYIEVTVAQRDKAPDNWTRKQTLKNAERYITPELKQIEDRVLGASSRAVEREQQLFAQLCDRAQQHLPALHVFAQAAAELDVLACFARRAVRHRYVRPEIVDEPVLSIDAGRHIVLDEVLADRFVPNDLSLLGHASDSDAAGRDAPPSLAIITGPNMAGKSTYIRQAALITLLAHTGSYVPADRATVGLCDRIFTRIGASDELHTGQSTFMVEMTETANICNHATPRSLIILDEIGRGTSTLDGLSLAWAIAEHLARVGARTLFATHYHEITSLAEQYANVGNLNVSVREWQDEIVFLHRIVTGATGRSYGIHVAKIAGVPRSVVDRANQLMAQLSVSHDAPKPIDAAPVKPPPGAQLGLFTEFVEHPAMGELRKVDINRLSPMDAFELLRKLREQIDES